MGRPTITKPTLRVSSLDKFSSPDNLALHRWNSKTFISQKRVLSLKNQADNKPPSFLSQDDSIKMFSKMDEAVTSVIHFKSFKQLLTDITFPCPSSPSFANYTKKEGYYSMKFKTYISLKPKQSVDDDDQFQRLDNILCQACHSLEILEMVSSRSLVCEIASRIGALDVPYHTIPYHGSEPWRRGVHLCIERI